MNNNNNSKDHNRTRTTTSKKPEIQSVKLITNAMDCSKQDWRHRFGTSLTEKTRVVIREERERAQQQQQSPSPHHQPQQNHIGRSTHIVLDGSRGRERMISESLQVCVCGPPHQSVYQSLQTCGSYAGGTPGKRCAREHLRESSNHHLERTIGSEEDAHAHTGNQVQNLITDHLISSRLGRKIARKVCKRKNVVEVVVVCT